MIVTIIGAGGMGRGIGIRLVAGGNDVEYIDSDPQEAAALAEDLAGHGNASAAAAPGGRINGDVVVLALPYGAIAGAVEQHGDRLTGKIVVEISNPVDFTTFDRLVTPADSSAAEEVAKLLPGGTPVVKAFNTTFAGTLVAGEVAGQSLDVLLASDNDEAKRTVAALVEQGGLRPIDAGPLRRARQLEHLGFLHMTLQESLGSQYASTVKLHW
jgi:8-hydroxy-5-deazaflavin:NADPH oxidoreductase